MERGPTDGGAGLDQLIWQALHRLALCINEKRPHGVPLVAALHWHHFEPQLLVHNALAGATARPVLRQFLLVPLLQLAEHLGGIGARAELGSNEVLAAPAGSVQVDEVDAALASQDVQRLEVYPRGEQAVNKE